MNLRCKNVCVEIGAVSGCCSKTCSSYPHINSSGHHPSGRTGRDGIGGRCYRFKVHTEALSRFAALRTQKRKEMHLLQSGKIQRMFRRKSVCASLRNVTLRWRASSVAPESWHLVFCRSTLTVPEKYAGLGSLRSYSSPRA